MKLLFVLFLIIMCGSAAAEESEGINLFVASNGSDSNPGTRSKPFGTLEGARNAVRQLKQAGLAGSGVTVWVRGGIYTVDRTFRLVAEDGRTKEAPVVYRAYQGETPRFIGGKALSGFQPVTDPKVLERMEESCRGKVLQCDLKAQGITDFGKITNRGFGRPVKPAHMELFFNGKPMTLARWPNEGEWAIVTGAPDGQNGGKFSYDGDRPKRWTKAEDIWLHGYWTWAWADSYEQVKSIDVENRIIATQPPHGVYGYSKGKRFYAFNILEELDQPGEWYLDRKTGILYFWPPEPVEGAECLVSIIEEPMVSLKDCSYVRIQGLTFECCRGSGVEVVGGTHNLVAGCTFRNMGDVAVWIGREVPDFATRVYGDTTFTGQPGTYNGVTGCDIYQTGEGGIILAGGDRKTLTPGHNFAENNHIWDYSRWVRTYRPGISITGVDNRAAHNLIHDAPHMAICIPSGNENVVEYNEIYAVCMETGDAGAFYMGRDYTQRGNIIRYNYFHDLGSYEDRFSAHNFTDTMAVYLDDWTSGTTVYGNIFYKANRAAMIGGGRDNTIENNIFVDCKPSIHVDGRGLGWAKYYFDGTDNTLWKRLDAVNYKKPPYSVRYPELVNIKEDEPAIPKGNRILRNICVGGKWIEIHNDVDKWVEMKDNFTEGDPGFVDVSNRDFRLKKDSPVFKLGFKPIPVEKIGIYKDSYRQKAP